MHWSFYVADRQSWSIRRGRLTAPHTNKPEGHVSSLTLLVACDRGAEPKLLVSLVTEHRLLGLHHVYALWLRRVRPRVSFLYYSGRLGCCRLPGLPYRFWTA
jgi:hypothetical protein